MDAVIDQEASTECAEARAIMKKRLRCLMQVLETAPWPQILGIERLPFGSHSRACEGNIKETMHHFSYSAACGTWQCTRCKRSTKTARRAEILMRATSCTKQWVP